MSENAVNMNVRNAGTQGGGTNCRRTRPTNRQGARRDPKGRRWAACRMAMAGWGDGETSPPFQRQQIEHSTHMRLQYSTGTVGADTAHVQGGDTDLYKLQIHLSERAQKQKHVTSIGKPSLDVYPCTTTTTDPSASTLSRARMARSTSIMRSLEKAHATVSVRAKKRAAEGTAEAASVSKGQYTWIGREPAWRGRGW
eukprot:scaffold15080_cov135-Isochrysis_galbana.AAC.1